MTQKLEFRAMGCRMLGIADAEHAVPALQAMPAQFEAWEQVLSRFRLDSELCELNRRAGMDVVVSEVLWEVFQASRQAEIETQGLVNPLVMDALVNAGYDRTFDELLLLQTDPQRRIEPVTVPSLDSVVADAEQHSLRLPRGARLDFGGIAKGWAAREAMNALSPYGPALFSAGGDVAVSGLRGDGTPWQIGVEDSFQLGGYIEQLYLEHGAVATSGKDYRHWLRSGVPQHHIIDPRTGLPAETDLLTATVIAPNTMLAEAFAKAILISGSEAGMARIDSDDRLAGLLVLENGQQLRSRRLERYL